jgi:hypothetical protein
MTQGDVDLLQHLCEEYRINFLGHLKPTDWPECHREKMAAIQTLGRTTFDAYAISTDELIQQPWKQDLKIQAKKLVKAAERCKQRNEHTWRTTCETIIRERFSAEVVWYVPFSWLYVS